MIRKIKKELIYFVLLLIILSIIQHSDFLSDPINRFNLIIEKDNYAHPLIWTLIVYMIIGAVRLTINFILFLKNSKAK